MAPKSYPIYLNPEAYRALLDLRLKEETPGDTVERIIVGLEVYRETDPVRYENLLTVLCQEAS